MTNSTKQIASEPNRIAYQMLIAIWFVAVASGFWLLTSYNFASNTVSSAPTEWPTGTNLKLDTNSPTLLVFIHPQCPCSSATLTELEQLVSEVDQQVKCTILMGCPSAKVDRWMRSSNVRTSLTMKGIQTVIDLDGAVATRFNITTSGHCLLYSVTGNLMFQGGITTERGHEGESCGQISIKNLIAGTPSRIAHFPVFGCELVRMSEKAGFTKDCGQEALK